MCLLYCLLCVVFLCVVCEVDRFVWLQMKKELSEHESITQEVVGNAHVENYAIKMFLYADNEDRSGRFHK